MRTAEKINNIGERDHGLIGIGEISYEYTSDFGFSELIITLHKLDKIIVYTGIEAKNIWKRVLDDNDDSRLNLVKRLACDSVGIPLLRIYENSRKEDAAFARWLTIWFAKIHMKMSYRLSGMIFNKDHSTAIHAINEIRKPDIYLKQEHRLWRKIFMDKLKEKELI